MISIDERKLRKSHKKAVTKALFIMAGLLVYGVLGEYVLKNAFEEPVYFYSDLLVALTVLSAIEIVMIVVARNFILSGKFRLSTTAEEEDAEPTTDQKENDFIKRLYTSFLTAYIISESIAFYGLFLYVIGKDQSVFYGFLGAALFLMFVQFPKFEDWESRLKEFLSD
jgi:hypothetical protein